MFKNYFNTAIRQLLRNKVFSLINIVGLSTGLASVLALSILVYQAMTANDNMKDIHEMYYLKTRASDGNDYSQTPFPLLGEIIKSCPEVVAGTHIQTWYYPWIKAGEKEFQETSEFVDTGYFRVFEFPFKYGDPKTAMQDKYSVVLSEEMAEKFFGNINPVGRVVTADDSVQLTISGVLKHIPTNSTIRPTVLFSTALLKASPGFRDGANWYNTFANNYLRLEKGSDRKKFEAKIANITRLHYPDEQKGNSVFAVPFEKITEDDAQLTGVIIRGAVGAGIFVLLIILVNIINLNTAGMYTRTKEVGIRKMMGGSKRSIVFQFIIENGIIVFVSIILAWFIFSLLLLPYFNDLVRDKFGEIETGLGHDYPLILLFAGIGILFTVLAASLPALKLISVKVTDAVKGKITSSLHQSGFARNTFITVQFVLAITLICVTIILNRQIRFMKSSALGFNKENIAVVPLNLAFRDQSSARARFVATVNELKNDPRVKAVSINGVIPTAYSGNYNNYSDPVTGKEIGMLQAPIDAGYIQTFQIPLIQGKNFDDNLAASQKNGVFINRAAMDLFGWKNAIGKQLRAGGEGETSIVMGVMENFHYRDLSASIEPLIQFYTGRPGLDYGGYLCVRTSQGNLLPVMEKLKKAFESMPSRRAFHYELMADKIDHQYFLFDAILKATNAIALLTIIIASLGMFGLISLFARLRIKEIGIRKVLGAGVADIVTLLSRDFLVIVGLALLIATPVAWYVMHTWLQDFAYRITIHWWMFLAAGGIALCIAFLTIGTRAIRAATTNPVNSLRTE